MSNAADAVNDVRPTGEPSFTSIAVCTGTDLDGNGVTLVNRLCMNSEAARIVQAESVQCHQQMKEDAALISTMDDYINEIKQSNFQMQYASLLMLFVIVCMCVREIKQLGSKK